MDSNGTNGVVASPFSSAEEIIAAVNALYEPARRRMRRPAEPPAAPRVKQERSGCCHCGYCASCLEEERWERIFNEKFACPEYYLARRQENWSTLARK
jgi:hypothetical protein